MITLLLIAITSLVSILCFARKIPYGKLIFNAYEVWHNRGWHRMLSYGLGYIFAPLYLLYCWWMARRKIDNIGHTAHFWGAVCGLLFPLICKPAIFQHFLSQLFG